MRYILDNLRYCPSFGLRLPENQWYTDSSIICDTPLVRPSLATKNQWYTDSLIICDIPLARPLLVSENQWYASHTMTIYDLPVVWSWFSPKLFLYSYFIAFPTNIGYGMDMGIASHGDMMQRGRCFWSLKGAVLWVNGLSRAVRSLYSSDSPHESFQYHHPHES